MYKLIVASFLLIIFSARGLAQGLSSFNNGSIGVSATLEPERKFKDSTGGYKYSALALNARISLFGKRSESSRKFFETSLHADLQSSSATFGFTNSSRNFLSGNLGLGAIVYNGGKNILLMNVAVGMAADQLVIDQSNTRYRFSGSFIVNHQHSSTTIYQYGAALTYAYGKPLLLPVLGIRTKLSGTWTLSTILPAELSFINKLNTKTGLSFSIRPAGNRFQFNNQDNFNTPSSTVYLQLREFQLSTALYYKFSKDFTVSGDLGFLVGSKLRFTEQDYPRNTLYETSVKPGALLRLSVRYRLPGKRGMHANKMQDILNPLGN